MLTPELEKEIRKLVGGDPFSIRRYFAFPDALDDLLKEIDRLRSPWIPVEERLPEVGETVLLHCTHTNSPGSCVVQAHRSSRDDTAWFTDIGSQPVERVPWPCDSDEIHGLGLKPTHWSRLQKPKEE